MRGTIITVLFTAILFSSSAQELHTTYFPNGHKAIEGRWKFTTESFLNTHMVMYGLVPLSTQVPTMNIICDGLIRTWYPNGTKCLEITFAAGIANGPYKAWYASGALQEEGTLKNGLPDGEWRSYHKSGQLNFTGHYNTPSQSELELRWNSLFKENAEGHTGPHTEQVGPALPNQDYEMTVYTLVQPFRVVEWKTNKLGSIRNGDFQLYDDEGGWMQIAAHFVDDLPNGTWTLYGRPNHKSYSLEYVKGKIVSMTDSFGKRKSIAELISDHNRSDVSEGLAAPFTEVAPLEPPNSTPKVFRYVEQMPDFVGNLPAFIEKNLRFPKGVVETSAKVYVQFVVSEEGLISNPEILKSGGKAFDEEALRLIKLMPRWKPGKQNGTNVAVYYALPVPFKKK